ncbi:MAG: NAD(P)-dependent oxidoreductase [Spongiibacteraceae bacterium]
MQQKIVITGGAGLVGQNLVLMLRELGYNNLTVIDKHAINLQLLAKLNPGTGIIHADVAQKTAWADAFEDCHTAIILHAQITAKDSTTFVRNNIDASAIVFDVLREKQVPFVIHISSSVVNSVADDDYTNTKKAQEKLFLQSGLNGCVLRPTLMYGWFDPKHFGWLSRFMEKAPVFPIPGHGRYMRQPLYERDFCRAIIWCLENQPKGEIYDLVGQDRIDYIDIIRSIRDAKGLKTPIVKIPYHLFSVLLKIYALFSDKPPFTASQLKALTAGDDFKGVDIEKTFGFKPTPFSYGINETFCHPVYSQYVVERT